MISAPYLPPEASLSTCPMPHAAVVTMWQLPWRSPSPTQCCQPRGQPGLGPRAAGPRRDSAHWDPHLAQQAMSWGGCCQCICQFPEKVPRIYKEETVTSTSQCTTGDKETGIIYGNRGHCLLSPTRWEWAELFACRTSVNRPSSPCGPLTKVPVPPEPVLAPAVLLCRPAAGQPKAAQLHRLRQPGSLPGVPAHQS